MNKDQKIKLFFAALYHDVGKPQTTKFNEQKQDIQAIDHENIGSIIAEDCLTNLIPKKLIKPILMMIQQHMLNESISNKSIVKRADEFIKHDICWNEILSLKLCDEIGRIGLLSREDTLISHINLYKRIHDLGVLNEPLPKLLSGKDLISIGFKSGKIIGKIMDEIRAKQCSFQLKTHEEAMDFTMRRFKKVNI